MKDFSCITPNEHLTRVAPIQKTEHVVEAILPDRRAQKTVNYYRATPLLLCVLGRIQD